MLSGDGTIKWRQSIDLLLLWPRGAGQLAMIILTSAHAKWPPVKIGRVVSCNDLPES